MRLVQRLVACLLVLLVLGESSGLARAFGRDSESFCCCGAHWTARPCHCPDCPASANRTRKTPNGDHLLSDHDCHGLRSGHAGILSVIALRLVLPRATATPLPVGVLVDATLLIRSGRAVEVDRPPP